MQERPGKKLFLLDAYALIYRSYYAFIKNPRINSRGMNTSAIFGFLLTLEELLQKQNPSHIAVAFDPPTPTFRHVIYSEYKANRDATPEDIKLAVPYIKSILEGFGIPILQVDGFEADDVIGTIAWQASERGFVTYMMTPDKDFAQLVRDNVLIYKPARAGGGADIWGVREVKSEFMVQEPLQVIDVLALMGDTADNVPGAPGIGPKTARKLIAQFGSVENLIERSDELKGKQQEVIREYSEKLLFSKRLVTIETGVPVEFSEENMLRGEPDAGKLRSIYEELEFRSMASKLPLSNTITGDEHGEGDSDAGTAMESSPGPQQGSLFGSQERGMKVSQAADIESTPHEYTLIMEKNEAAALAERMSQLNNFCFDTETTSINPLEASLVAIAFSWEKGKGYLVWIPEEKEEAAEMLKPFIPLLQDENITKTGQNLKYDIQVLAGYGIEVRGPLFDTMIAHYLIEPDMRHNMDLLSENYLSYKPVPIESLIGEKGKGQKSMRSVDPTLVCEYAVEDADVTWQLAGVFGKMLEEMNLSDLAQRIEMPLIPVLARMERHGVEINSGEITAVAEDLRTDIIALEREIYALTGTEFNISSPKQLGDVLFLKLKLDDKARKTKTRQFVTNEEVLQRLTHRHPVVGKVLEYRGLKKLLSTYVEALPALVNQATGRIHTSYNQAVAATGRLSSNNPNLQNIPVRDERGREIRKAFIPAGGYRFFAADYSQIELRLMAHLSGDRAMIDDFMGEVDIHSATASKIFGVDPREVTREMRAKAKTANFGIIYGISAYGLSQRLNISRSEAKELIDGYFESYPGVKEYMDRCIGEARERGYVTTIYGRRRELRDINSRNALLRSNAERNAINAPIQGSAADIIKIAMIDIDRELSASGLNARMIMQVHDELVFEVTDADLDSLRGMVLKKMSSATELAVPLIVEWGAGSNWLEAH
ncbi:MAG: DNA polymerase I [Bacteroidales bacterium]|nr:DNA polymerase I [Bacteroidales bacterium]